MDSRNFAIGVLSTTAVVLFVGLVLVQTQPEPAQAFGMNAQGGDYLLITGQLEPSEELLYVIDARSERMLIYRCDVNRRQIQRVSGQSLGQIREAAAPEAEKTDNTRRSGRGRGR